ncbi:leucyl aminopeptidase [Thermoleophilum album]|uniref:Probable cytosol aminopeptidase n=1 Tax=Thermoleophilum album TaxID=29539 RepID=A0A1H6FJK9_THEAL|nr:leucyl aminopeptidase [Thermoleophilum album]SEH10348.1 leucyl aminopeptidase [Thermoleophilum album]
METVDAIEVQVREGELAEASADARVVFLFDDESPADPVARRLLELGEAKKRFKAVAHGHDERNRRVITVGLGARADLDAERLRVAAALAVARACELGARTVACAVPQPPADTSAGGAMKASSAPRSPLAAALVEGALLRLYRFNRFKSDSDERPTVRQLELYGAADAQAVARARVAAIATNRARDLQNLPGNVATPTHLAERAAEIADQHSSLEVELFDREGIERLGMGAFAAVARGSANQPRLIVMRYTPNGASGPHLGFVGKAVTFDTGGISIKPASRMHEMKYDMSGGAAVIEALDAIAALGLPVRVTAVVPATENMPDGGAFKPGDIVTALNGRTIEITNTDAEGRLLLADALTFAVREGAERLVDLATLTGAIVVTLGSTYAGLFGNDEAWCAEVAAAFEAAGEPAWRLPLHPDFKEMIRGEQADLVNASQERKALSCYAAQFLAEFVDGRPWAHLDIAGTAWGRGREYVGKGASGFGVRALIALAERCARSTAPGPV